MRADLAGVATFRDGLQWLQRPPHTRGNLLPFSVGYPEWLAFNKQNKTDEVSLVQSSFCGHQGKHTSMK